MQKQETKLEQPVPVKVYIDEMQQKRKIAEALEPLHLTEKALVLVKGRNALVITEKALSQIEELGRMALELHGGRICELKAVGVGMKINDEVSLVNKLVTPSKDNVLVVKESCNLRVSRFLSSRMSEEEHSKLEPLIDKDELIISLVDKAVNLKEESGYYIKLLKVLEGLGEFPNMFADSGMSLGKLLKTDWDIIMLRNTYLPTEHFEDKLKRAQGKQFDVHVHLDKRGEEPHISPADIFNAVIDKHPLEWFGTLHVRHTKPEEFKFNKNDLLAFHSRMRDSSWSRRVSPIKDMSWHQTYPLLLPVVDEFEEKRRAEVLTYGELMKQLG